MNAPRVLVGCLFQEGNTFTPGHTTRAAFDIAGVLVGDELRRERLPAGKELAAAWDALVADGIEVVPALFAWAPPGPPIQADDYRALSAEIVDRADTSIDGVYLQLHGSMVVEGMDDPEGDLLERIRVRLRPDVPIAASFDLHATMTSAMASALDIVTAYGTCPHVDLARTGAHAGRLLADALRGRCRPVVAWAPLAMTAPPDRHDDAFPPFAAAHVRVSRARGATRHPRGCDAALPAMAGHPRPGLVRRGDGGCRRGPCPGGGPARSRCSPGSGARRS